MQYLHITHYDFYLISLQFFFFTMLWIFITFSDFFKIIIKCFTSYLKILTLFHHFDLLSYDYDLSWEIIFTPSSTFNLFCN